MRAGCSSRGRVRATRHAMIYAIDVGSTLSGKKGTAFAWARVPPAGGVPLASQDLRALLDAITGDLHAGRHVALGFEAPLFIPVPDDETKLSRARAGEKNGAWSAPAGGYVATLALHQSAWLLRELRLRYPEGCAISVDPTRWSQRDGERSLLFCWEAFVAGPAHRGHRRDAATAATYFQARQGMLESAVAAENPLSLLGAAVLWSGWSTDVGWLHRPAVVLRPGEAWDGDVEEWVDPAI